MSVLFSPFRLADMEFSNRIVVSPMCQHMAQNGIPSDWHMIHWGQLALSGAALVMIESTAVEPEGRIGHRCVGLYSDEAASEMGRMIDAAKRYGSSRFGVQLSHAGRKASSINRRSLTADEGAWQTYSASETPLNEGWPAPKAADRDDLDRIRRAFASAASRAADAGVDVIELHLAHGYLFHQFLSPLTNQRTDAYGGSSANRMRFPLEVFDAVREAWPAGRPLGARISGCDWIEGGLTVEDAVELAAELRRRGCDFCDVSSGGISPVSRPPQVTSSYQVPLAVRVRSEVEMPTFAVGMIVEPHQAEDIIASGAADFVCIGRAFLNDPRWPWHAAIALGADIAYPTPYQRSHPTSWAPAKSAWTTAASTHSRSRDA